jgi:hypothetical protein
MFQRRISMAKEQLTLIQPNHFQLRGHQNHGGSNLHVTYLTHSGPVTPQFPQGPPHFTYQDANISRTFAGPEVQVVETELGAVVSVVIRLTPDSGSTTFSLLVPRVNLIPGQPAAIHTDGITALHRLSLVPGLNHGQQDQYSVTPLEGTAANVIVPL